MNDNKFYVDNAIFKKKNGKKLYAHLITSGDINELHKFAESLGIKRHFFHSDEKHSHYDITEEQRIKVIESGAIAVSSKELIKIIKNK